MLICSPSGGVKAGYSWAWQASQYSWKGNEVSMFRTHKIKVENNRGRHLTANLWQGERGEGGRGGKGREEEAEEEGRGRGREGEGNGDFFHCFQLWVTKTGEQGGVRLQWTSSLRRHLPVGSTLSCTSPQLSVAHLLIFLIFF